jgi:hypothetical protein
MAGPEKLLATRAPAAIPKEYVLNFQKVRRITVTPTSTELFGFSASGRRPEIDKSFTALNKTA